MPGGRAQVAEERGVDLAVEHVHARCVGRAGQDAERRSVGLECVDCSVCIRHVLQCIGCKRTKRSGSPC
jgi:hypothetical protein